MNVDNKQSETTRKSWKRLWQPQCIFSNFNWNYSSLFFYTYISQNSYI